MVSRQKSAPLSLHRLIRCLNEGVALDLSVSSIQSPVIISIVLIALVLVLKHFPRLHVRGSATSKSVSAGDDVDQANPNKDREYGSKFRKCRDIFVIVLTRYASYRLETCKLSVPHR